MILNGDGQKGKGSLELPPSSPVLYVFRGAGRADLPLMKRSSAVAYVPL